MILVRRIWYWIYWESSTWHFSWFSSLVCLLLFDTVRRNSISVTHGTLSVKWHFYRLIYDLFERFSSITMSIIFKRIQGQCMILIGEFILKLFQNWSGLMIRGGGTQRTWRRYAAFCLFRQYTVKFTTIRTSYHRLKSLGILKNSIG